EIRSASGQSAEMKNSLSIQITLGEIATKKKSGEKLTSEQERLLKNLQDFPSYEMREKEIELVTLWGKGDKSITHKAQKLRQDQQQAEAKLIEVYKLYGQKIPREFAAVYQQLGAWGGEDSDKFDVDFIDVEDVIAKSLLENISHFSTVDLELFKAAVEDEKFLKAYVKKFVVNHDISQKSDLSYAEAKSVLKDPKLLKELPSAYSHYKYERYIDENSKTIDLLQKSPLCFGLSEAEVIDLHMHMTLEQLERYTSFNISYEEALGAIAKAIETEHPAIVAVQSELETIEKTVKRVVQDDCHKIVQHYATTFMKNVDMSTFVKEVRFPVDIADQANKVDFKAKGYQEIKKYYNDVDEETLKLAVAKAEFVKREFLDTPTNWPIFKHFRQDLKEFIKDGHLRSAIYQQIYYEILNQLVMINGDSLGDFVLVSSITTPPKEKVTIIPYSNLSIYDKSDFTGFYLSTLVNKLVTEGRIKDVTSLSSKDLILVHQEIQKFKENRCIEADGCLFARDHLGLLIQFKATLPEYENKLFYGYSEIVDKIMAHNHKILEEIKKQPKKES
ncbi:MAG TPA: hypothetical protein VNJ29_02180, partial [Candidatus Nitrosotenuis sp.]|nr:hypothetical protein [Candidatus Nitrosotenuis sp.]